MTDKLLIDLDVYCFKAASACETRSIMVTNERGKTKQFKHRTEFKAWLQENGNGRAFEDFTVVDHQECEEEAFCYSTLKKMIENTKKATGIQECLYFISGKGNFRDELPLPVQYKSSRKENIKPLLLEGCRDFAMKKFKPIVANGMEADDMLASATYNALQRGEKWVQCTIDKDAEGYDGWIYNIDKDETPRLIQGLGKLWRDDKGKVRGYGYIFFCFQLVNGDPVDVYCPSDMVRLTNPKFKLGEVGVYNLLKGVTTVEEADAVVDKWYTDMFPESVTYRAWNGEEYTKSAKEIQKMYFDCAYMRKDVYANTTT